MDESASAFDYVYAPYFVERVRKGTGPLTPDDLRALIEALAEASRGQDRAGGGYFSRGKR